MIKYQFDIIKIIQIVNHILNQNNGRINYTKMIKLLYIADKEFMKITGNPITFDEPYSMKNGPNLSNTYDLIMKKAKDENQNYWNNIFIVDQYDIVKLCNNNIKSSLLSKYEIEILNKVNNSFKKKSWQEMIEYTHNKDIFPEVEWEKAEQDNTSYKIKYEDILKSIGKTEAEIESISDDLLIYQKESAILDKVISL